MIDDEGFVRVERKKWRKKEVTSTSVMSLLNDKENGASTSGVKDVVNEPMKVADDVCDSVSPNMTVQRESLVLKEGALGALHENAKKTD